LSLFTGGIVTRGPANFITLMTRAASIYGARVRAGRGFGDERL
jgi:hypothetical protein